MLRILLLSFIVTHQVLITEAQIPIRKYEQNIVSAKDSSVIRSFFKLFKGKPNPLIDSTNITISRFILSINKMEGKKINTIQIDQRHFGAVMNLSKPSVKDALTRLADQLHDRTNDETIRKNLFIQEGDQLNSLVIAYNEKWLRDLPYIQDARIVASPVVTDSNSVDLFVITKDVFPIGINLNFKKANAFETHINTENINDAGNGFGITHSYDHERTTRSGWGATYTSRNIRGSFIDIALGGKTFENNYANHASSAFNVFIRGEKKLLTPLSRWTGGFDFNLSENANVFPTLWTDSLFKASLNYRLQNADVWAGYQLFNSHENFKNERPRHFVQIRYFNHNFQYRPIQYLQQLDKNYQNLIGRLLSYTIFKQKIIRTQYLYGFGRNEDLPSGNSITITTGHFIRELEAIPYFGLQFERYAMGKNEHFKHLNFSIGSCYVDKNLQDIRILASLEEIGKIHYLTSGYRYRRILNISFAETLKNKYNEALLINSMYGIPLLNKEGIHGGTRISANWESIWYNSRGFYGFRKAPFVFANLTYMRTVGDPIKNGSIYSALGGGIRIRNENLVFGTIELKGFYFPKVNYTMSQWNLTLSTNLRFKYNSSIINKPDFVQIN